MRLRDGHPRSLRILHILPIVFALVAAGCDTASGGGWITGVRSDRATFGFSVRCKDVRVNGRPVAELSDGHLEWHDGDVSFHGLVDSQAVPTTCEQFDLDSPTITFTGTYTLRTTGESGTFTATVYDGGEPGAMNGDSIDVVLMDGFVVTYANGGVIQEGNIQVL